MQNGLWAVILAGGEGQRMRALTGSWLGKGRPKQYCTFVGTRSMLKHTLDRTSDVVNPKQIVTVIGENHQVYLWDTVAKGMPGRILEQPSARGTGAAVFLAATFVLATNPNATFLIRPSDHFVYPEFLFAGEPKEMVRMADVFDNCLILLGVKPDCPEQDYGWIEAGTEQRERTREVKAFREKPGPVEAREFLQRRYLWNTMIIAARGQALWRLGKKFFPGMIEKLQTLRTALEAICSGQIQHAGTDASQVDFSHLSLLSRIHADLAPVDFSTELLQRASDQMLVFQMDDRVMWSDWGRPERVSASLKRIGKKPRFPQASVSPQSAAFARLN